MKKGLEKRRALTWRSIALRFSSADIGGNYRRGEDVPRRLLHIGVESGADRQAARLEQVFAFSRGRPVGLIGEELAEDVVAEVSGGGRDARAALGRCGRVEHVGDQGRLVYPSWRPEPHPACPARGHRPKMNC